jgi:hypothetical protein
MIFLFNGEGKRKSISGREKTSVFLVVELIIVIHVINVRKEKIIGFTVSVVKGSSILGLSKEYIITKGKIKSNPIRRAGIICLGFITVVISVFLKRRTFRYKRAFIEAPP